MNGVRAGAVLGISGDGTVTEACPADGRFREVLVIKDKIYALIIDRSPADRQPILRRDGVSEDRLVELSR